MTDLKAIRCPTGKMAFTNPDTATKSMRVLKRRGKYRPAKVYRCSECGLWHLASKGRK